MEIGKSNSTGQWRLNEPATVSDELHQQQQQQSAQCLQKQTVVSSSSHSNATINVSHYSVSPYLYHILVLVLLTAAQCAGKPDFFLNFPRKFQIFRFFSIFKSPSLKL